ncbi:MAG: dTDP-4-dehydrorhamnose 3,5-epimerase [Bacteroidales bacterium]|nr:dTDP-4-dehydrorhamnose 3,5-epimerase [Bacteroidales bacterium]
MNIVKTAIDGVLILYPTVYGDDRGYFFESFNQQEFERATGLSCCFVQDNESKSVRGVVRGLHFQKPPHAQAKLVRVVSGRVVDVAVDIRGGSPTYGHHVAVELSEENHRQLYIPKGFAHGFAVLSDEAVFQYKCDDYYHPEIEDAIAWNDPQLNIDWGISESEVRLSPKDSNHKFFARFQTPFV